MGSVVNRSSLCVEVDIVYSLVALFRELWKSWAVELLTVEVGEHNVGGWSLTPPLIKPGSGNPHS